MSETKARVWTAVLYPESMKVPLEDVEEVLQGPGCYIVHDKDVNKEGELLKAHIHIFKVWNGGITYGKALEEFRELGEVNKVERVKGVEFIYEYFIHNTEKAKKAGKYQYSPEERISFNGFNIDKYKSKETTSERAEEVTKALCSYIVQSGISNFIDLYRYAVEVYGEDGYKAVSSRSGFLEKLTRGNYLKRRAIFEEQWRENAFSSVPPRISRTRETGKNAIVAGNEEE